MKKSEALALQEGDLVDISAPRWQGGPAFGCKVLVVSSKGGVFVTGSWGGRGPSRWVQYHHVSALGRREELTDQERDVQRHEVERFLAYREHLRQKTRKEYLRRKRSPQDLYNFVWDELEGAGSCALEVLQAKAEARGLKANATTWQRIGRSFGCDEEVWETPLKGLNTSEIVLPGQAA